MSPSASAYSAYYSSSIERASSIIVMEDAIITSADRGGTTRLSRRRARRTATRRRKITTTTATVTVTATVTAISVLSFLSSTSDAFQAVRTPFGGRASAHPARESSGAGRSVAARRGASVSTPVLCYSSSSDDLSSSSSSAASSSASLLSTADASAIAAILDPDDPLALEEVAAAEAAYVDPNATPLYSKLFNAALLCVSFGFAFYTLVNVDAGMTRGWTQQEIAMRVPLDAWTSYESSLAEKPVFTKTVINVVIYLLGDWLSQTVFRGSDVLDFDAGRTLRNGFIGMCFGPLVHQYYDFSDCILPVDVGMNRVYKILMDQTVYLYVKCSIYLVAVAVLGGESFRRAAADTAGKIGGVMLTAWKFWPLVHCVTYTVIPAPHRVLWVNSVDLIWNAILATKASGDDEEEELEEEGEDAGAKGTALATAGGGVDSARVSAEEESLTGFDLAWASVVENVEAVQADMGTTAKRTSDNTMITSEAAFAYMAAALAAATEEEEEGTVISRNTATAEVDAKTGPLSGFDLAWASVKENVEAVRADMEVAMKTEGADAPSAAEALERPAAAAVEDDDHDDDHDDGDDGNDNLHVGVKDSIISVYGGDDDNVVVNDAEDLAEVALELLELADIKDVEPMAAMVTAVNDTSSTTTLA
eukprot:CAMPEP_0113570062 /NCGR_PEP_ID=MMETSP0015_2-20120614/24756_1 /TAXON_ID=2838 /ORGANISM="Odontella" /LENGTH=647 /DNA_ID=CAMNT_0000472793 /DNA_START=124 /DNA_END=2067 /DNA_ORIENTATION=- /assembly_acc=CAM_ASM_000160